MAYDLAFISNLEASNGIAVRSQEAKAPPGGLHIEPGETLTFMGEELQDIGIELREEDLELNAAAEGVRERVIRDRVLPEGDYEMCVQAVDFFDHTRDLSRRAPNGCEEFSILHFSQPVIYTPEHESEWAAAEGLPVRVTWKPSTSRTLDFDGTVYYRIKVVDLTFFPDEDPYLIVSDPAVSGIDLIESETESVILEIPDDHFTMGHQYIIRVTAFDPEGRAPFIANGHSVPHIFRYGAPEGDASVCREPDYQLESIYPAMMDTLPFRFVPCVTRFAPYCDNYTRLNFDFSLTDGSGHNYRRTDHDGWPNGPLDYLIHHRLPPIPEADEFRASHLYYNLKEEQERQMGPLQRGETYTWDVKTTMYMNGVIRDGLPSNTTPSRYVSGMTRPQLQEPENNATLEPGVVSFHWLPNRPESLFPPIMDLIISDHGEWVDNQQIGEVHERFVFQVSTSDRFADADIIHTESGEIRAEVGPDTDEEDLYALLYADQNTDREFDDEGEYFWRVLWLKNPNSDETNPDSEQFYHSSSTFTFTIAQTDESNLVKPCEWEKDYFKNSDEANPDCETGCDPPAIANRTEIDNYRNVSEFEIGFFRITEVEWTDISSRQGKGQAIIPFLNDARIKVVFNNIRINTDTKVYFGEVRAAEEDVPFSLADINSWVNLPSGTFGHAGQVNQYLKEFPEGRIIGALVGDRPVGMPFGFQREIEGQSFLIGITEMHFNPEGARAKILVEMQFDAFADDQWISFGASACIKPAGFGANTILYMQRDLPLSNWGDDPDPEKPTFVLKGLNSSTTDPDEIKRKASHIEFKCGCVNSIGLKFGGQLSTRRFVKDTEDGSEPTEPVTFDFDILMNRTADCSPESLPDYLPHNNTNFIANFRMDDWQFKGLDGWGFRIEEAYIDISSLENPTGFVFPEGYDHAAARSARREDLDSGVRTSLANTWKGMYLKRLAIRPPRDFVAEGEERPFTFGIENLIIDNTGFSAEINANNILSEETGDAGGWAFSIDEIEIRILQNVFRSGSLGGRLGLPIQEEGEYMEYGAMLTYTPEEPGSDDHGMGFILSVEPGGRFKMPVAAASCSLKENSYIGIATGYVPDELVDNDAYVEGATLSLLLDGSLDIGSSNAGSVSSASSFAFNGIDFTLKYDTKTDSIQFIHHLHSPQKFMGGTDDEGEGMNGFPVTLENIRFGIDLSPESGDYGGSISVTPHLNLMSDDDGGIEASVELSFYAKYNVDTKRFRLDSIGIGCVHIGLETGGEGSESSGISLKGAVCFYKNKDRCGQRADGLSGVLKVGLPVATVDLSAEFGYSRTGDYRYWFVDGMAKIKNGVPLGVLSLNGIGGGVYYNMTVETPGRADDNGYNRELITQTGGSIHGASESVASGEEGPSGDAHVNASGFRVCPNEGMMVFKAVLAIATSGDPSVFNMDISVQATARRGQGLTQFSIIGDGYIMADIPKRASAPVKADVLINFEKSPHKKLFSATFDAYIDLKIAGIIELNGLHRQRAFDGVERSKFVGMAFLVETYTDDRDSRWYFKMGAPKAPSGVKLSLFEKELLAVRSYFQIGSETDPGFMEMPQLITDILEGSKGSSHGSGGGLASTGNDASALPSEGSPPRAGFKTGLGLEASVELDAFLIYASLKFALGFDVALENYNNEGCRTSEGRFVQPIGFDGWYATGRMYAGIEGEVGLQLKLIKTRRFHLFKLGAAFVISGGFPNPVWARGRAGVYYSVLGGLIDGEAQFEFALGEKCIPPRNDPFGFSIIEDFNPADGATAVSPFVNPQVSFTIPMDTELKIPVIPEDEELDEDEEYPNVVVDRLIPYIDHENSKLKEYVGGRWTERTCSIHLNANKDVATYAYSGLFDNSRVNVQTTVKAREWKNNRWEKAQWPPENKIGKRGEWSEKEEATFTTGPLPETIETLVSSSVPYLGQRFFIENGPFGKKTGRIDFFENLQKDYFYSEKDGEKYTYVVRFDPVSESERIEKDIHISRNSLTYDLPDLEEATIYNVSLIRRRMTNDGGNGILGRVGGNITGRGRVVANNTSLRHVVSRHDLSNSTGFNYLRQHSLSKEFIPGMYDTSEDDFALLRYSFKTSKYRSLNDKLENTEIEFLREDDEFRSPVLQISGDEGFDVFDMTYYERSFVTGVRKIRQPEFGLYDDYSSSYWKTKAEPRYQKIKDFTGKFYDESKRRSLTRFGSLSAYFEVTANVWDGEIKVDYRDPNVPDWDRTYVDQPKLNLSFHHWMTSTETRGYRIKEIDERYLQGPLTSDEVQREWNMVVGKNNAKNSSTAGTSNNGIPGTLVSSGALNSGVLGRVGSHRPDVRNTALNNDRRVRLRLYYTLHQRIVTDIAKFQSAVQNLYNHKLTYRVPVGPISHTTIFENETFMRDHILKYEPNFRSIYNEWSRISTRQFSLDNNPGTYKVLFVPVLMDSDRIDMHFQESHGRRYSFRVN